MDSFVWKKEYELGLTVIDEQHKELFIAANRFFEEFATGNRTELEKLLLELKRYVLNHFNYEEKFMKLYEYKEFNEHQSQHDQFSKDILEIELKIRNNEKGVSLEILHFLNKWIVDHISSSDRKYVDLFKKRGQS